MPASGLDESVVFSQSNSRAQVVTGIGQETSGVKLGVTAANAFTVYTQ